MSPRLPTIDANAALSFVRVVERGSFRAAASVEGLPRSTISRRVAALEDRLGVRLLERTTRTLRLTEAGKAFLAEAQPAAASLAVAVKAVIDEGERPHGLVRMSAPVMFGQLMLGAALPQVLKRHPQIKLAVELEDRMVDLVREGFDLAVRTGALPPSSLVAKRLGATRVGLFASPRYLERRGTPKTIEALAEHDALVMGTLERHAQWKFRVGRRERAARLQPRVHVNNFAVLASLCTEGLGIARLPRPLAEPLLELGHLVPLLEAHELPAVPVQLVWPQGKTLPARTRAVIDVLAEILPRALS